MLVFGGGVFLLNTVKKKYHYAEIFPTTRNSSFYHVH